MKLPASARTVSYTHLHALPFSAGQRLHSLRRQLLIVIPVQQILQIQLPDHIQIDIPRDRAADADVVLQRCVEEIGLLKDGANTFIICAVWDRSDFVPVIEEDVYKRQT